jgi:predicted RNase H-like nuclease (RuvC/YqgF family)
MEHALKNELKCEAEGIRTLKYIPETDSEIYYFNKLQQSIAEIKQLKKEIYSDKAEIYDLGIKLESRKAIIKRLEKDIKKLEGEVKHYKEMSIDGKVKLTAREEIMTLKNKLIERDHMITQLIKSKNENQEKATQENGG